MGRHLLVTCSREKPEAQAVHLLTADEQAEQGLSQALHCLPMATEPEGQLETQTFWLRKPLWQVQTPLTGWEPAGQLKAQEEPKTT